MTLEVTTKGRTQKRHYDKRDQFAPELIYFSDCIRSKRNPEPSGLEGLLDVHIIRALLESAATGRPVKLRELRRRRRPDLRQAIYRPPARRRPRVHTQAPAR
jgi:glucose-fructose oxidoreductase